LKFFPQQQQNEKKYSTNLTLIHNPYLDILDPFDPLHLKNHNSQVKSGRKFYQEDTQKTLNYNLFYFWN